MPLAVKLITAKSLHGKRDVNWHKFYFLKKAFSLLPAFWPVFHNISREIFAAALRHTSIVPCVIVVHFLQEFVTYNLALLLGFFDDDFCADFQHRTRL